MAHANPRSLPRAAAAPRLADHSADARMLMLAAMATIIGAGGVVAAWVLLRLIAIVTNLAWFGRLSSAPSAIAAAGAGIVLTLAVPMAGSVIVGLIARFGSDKIRGHGIPEAIEAILYGESRLSWRVALLKPISSAIAIGSGGPFGAEGPIIMTGGAIGSLFAQRFRLSAAERKTLLVAGASAGMTGIFGTPVAAILLAIEVLLFEWKPRSFVPVVVAALSALAWRPLLIGSGPLFPFDAALPGGGAALAGAAALGCVGGGLAALLSTALYRIEDGFHRLPVQWMWWPAIGATIVGIGGWIDPRVLGAGYASIQDLLNGALMVKAMALLLVTKGGVWLIALGSGTSGGILAPLLILGGALGGIAGHWLPGGPGPWALLGMAAVMSAAMRAPLTAAIFAVELTGHWPALPATVTASVSAYALAVLVLKRSILTEKIARRGRHVMQEYRVDPLALAQARQIMTADPATLPATMPIPEAIAFFETARHRSYPVIDDNGRPIAIVSRADALLWRQDLAAPDVTLGERTSDGSLPIVEPATPATDIANLMIAEGIGRVCVIDPADGRLIGLIARRNLLGARATSLDDERRG
ncbi:MAG: chloride channel protein [Sphingomonas sp.]